MKRNYTLYKAAARRELTAKGRFYLFACALVAVACILTALSEGAVVGIALFACGVSIVGTVIDWPNSFRNARLLGLRSGIIERLITTFNGFSGVANSGTGTLNLPVGVRYHELKFFCTIAGVLSDPTTVASNIKIIVNGVVMCDASPAQLINHAKTENITPGTGEIPLYLSEPWKFNPQAIEETSWDLFGQGTMQVIVTFLNPGGGAVGITCLAAWDRVRNARMNRKTKQVEPFLKLIKRLSISKAMPAGSGNITTELPNAYPIKRIFIDVSANAISDVLLMNNGEKVVEATLSQYQQFLNGYRQVGTFFGFPLIFDYDRMGNSALIPISPDLKLNTTGALTATLFMQTVVPGFQ